MKYIEGITTFINKYLFIIVTLVMAILAYLYQREKKTVRDLYYEVEKTRIKGTIDALTEKAKISEDKYGKSLDDYNKFKSTHSDAFKRHGIM